MRYSLTTLLVLACLAGCAQNSAPNAPLPDDRKQPRLVELLVYLEYRGVEGAAKAPVFELSHWVMYDNPTWETDARKPRLEGATIQYKGMKTILAISPVKTPLPDPKLVRTDKEKDGKKVVVGATLVPANRHWSVGFTMAEPDAKLQGELEQFITGFVGQFKP
ncbi:MAG: hypothetical protein ACHRHE_15405 [Tepidisphaerales bacterium]